MDPIERFIEWQQRSLDIENLKDAIQDCKRFWTHENRLIGAYDLKYHRNELDEERRKQLLKWIELGVSTRDLAPIMEVSQRTAARWVAQLKASL